MKEILMLLAFLLTLVLLDRTIPAVPYAFHEKPYYQDAVCDTDEDCMRYCPPPADDSECDGGPQS